MSLFDSDSNVTSIRGDGLFGIGGARRCDFFLELFVVVGERVFLRVPNFGCPSEPNDMASVVSRSVKSIVSEVSLIELVGVFGRIMFDQEAIVLNISLTWGGNIRVSVSTTIGWFSCCFPKHDCGGSNFRKVLL